MGFYEWLREKLKFQLFTLGIVGLALVIAYFYERSKSSSSSTASARRYAEAPEYCKCSECGYVLEMKGEYAGKHCPEIEFCPKCGASGSMRRVK